MIGIDLHKWLFLLVNGREKSPLYFPYHGCALPTELGGVSLSLQLEAYYHGYADEYRVHIAKSSSPRMIPDPCC
jgi:hypothetical protein